jgi:hypothetical protein
MNENFVDSWLFFDHLDQYVASVSPAVNVGTT